MDVMHMCNHCGRSISHRGFCSENCRELDHYTEGFMEAVVDSYLDGDIPLEELEYHEREYYRIHGEQYSSVWSIV
jgi:hypothetical protein